LEEFKMNLKKIVASVAAAAVAVTTMAVSSFASFSNGDVYVDLVADGYDVLSVYGFSVTVSGDYSANGAGGGIGFDSNSTGWAQTEWGNEGSGKEVIITDNTVTLLKDAPVFSEADITGEAKAAVWIQSWWGDTLTVESYKVLGANGTELQAGAASTESAETETADAAPAEESKEEVAPAADDASAETIAEDADDDEDVIEAEDEDVVDDVDIDEDDEDVEFVLDTEDDSTVDTDAATDDTAAETTTPAADSTTTTPKAGNTAVAVVFAVAAVAGAAAVVSKKRK
jgi:hypothetical protein